MSNVAKLKKKAAEFEQKKQFDKALQTYLQILDSDKLEDADVALYNRVGDLLLRQGDVAQAVDYYEKAVDLYSDGGFFNNAIALCNKILRNSPGRNSIYYKLGKISARKGFTSDAKQNFLEYADRMQKAGQMDEAFRALKEFADLCPDQDDIRLMLADQLSKKNRKGEALEQLQTLYEKFEAEGRAAEARATIDRMKAIDPAAQPKASAGDEKKQKSNELIFLEVDFDKPGRGKAAPPKPERDSGVSRPAGRAPLPEPPNPVGDLPLLETESYEPAATAQAPGAELRTEFTPPAELPPELEGDGGLVAGFEQTGFQRGAGAVPNDFDVGFGGNILDLDRPRVDPEESGSVGHPPHDLSLHGDLPMLDLPSDIGDGLLFQPTELTEDSRETRAFVEGLTPAIERQSKPDLGVSSEFLQLEVGAESLLNGLTLDPDPLTDPVPGAGPSLDDGVAPLAEVPPEAPLPPPTEPAHTHRPASAAGTSALARVEQLRDQVRQDEQNPALRREYAEALLELGEREGGLHELELAMIAFERSGDLDSAESVADEIIRLDPNSVRHHQKRVEYAFRTSDRSRLVDAYLELADSLFRTGQADKARAVYQRVLELAPDDIRAQAALSAFIDPVPAAPPPKKEKREQSGTYRRYTADMKKEPEPAPTPRAGSDDEFVDLGEWLREEKGGKSTRMVVEEQAPTGDEEADFADMLKRFKQGVAENVEEEDHESHYDLGVAYKEMGLLDEAIGEFQKALRGSANRVRTYEALGLCFLEKSQFQVARTVLARALGEGGVPDDQLVGVLYLIGYACEGLQRLEEALGYYQRVFAVDIDFRDVAQRIAALERVIA